MVGDEVEILQTRWIPTSPPHALEWVTAEVIKAWEHGFTCMIPGGQTFGVEMAKEGIYWRRKEKISIGGASKDMVT